MNGALSMLQSPCEIYRYAGVGLWAVSMPTEQAARDTLTEMKRQGASLLVVLTDDTGMNDDVEKVMSSAYGLGMGQVHFGLPSAGLPVDIWSFADFCYELERRLVSGVGICVTCSNGVDRTGLVMQTLLGRLGFQPGEADGQWQEATGKKLPRTHEAWLYRQWPLLTGTT